MPTFPYRPLFCLLTLLYGTSAQAAPTPDELRQLESTIKEQRASIERAREAHSSSVNTLRDTERQQARLRQELHALETRRVQAEVNLELLLAEQTSLDADLAAGQTALADQLRMAYMLGDDSLARLLLDKSEPGSLERQMDYLGRLGRARQEQIERLRETQTRRKQLLSRIESERSTLDQAARAAQDKQKALDAARQTQQKQAEELEGHLKAQQTELERMEQKRRALQELMKRLEAHRLEEQRQEEKRLEEQRLAEKRREEEARKAAAQAGKGETRPPAKPDTQVAAAEDPAKAVPHVNGALPVNGRILRSFGSTLGIGSLRSEGIFFATEQGVPVRAISDGRVVFADWMNGFGHLIILRHTDGYLSLYAHAESLYRKEGDRVKAGEVIAAAGRSGGAKETGLYLEVRKRGQPVNPTSWPAFKRQR